MPGPDFYGTGTGTRVRTRATTDVVTRTYTEVRDWDEELAGRLQRDGIGRDGVWPLKDTYAGRTEQLPKPIIALATGFSHHIGTKELLGIDVGASDYANTIYDISRAFGAEAGRGGIRGYAIDVDPATVEHIRHSFRHNVDAVEGNGWHLRDVMQGYVAQHDELSQGLLSQEGLEGQFGIIVAANSLALAVSPRYNRQPQADVDAMVDGYFRDLQYLLAPGEEPGEIGGVGIIAVGGAALAVGCTIIDGKKVLTVPPEGWWEVKKTTEAGQTYQTRALGVFVDRLKALSQGEDPVVAGEIPLVPRLQDDATNFQPFNYPAHVPVIGL